MNDEERRVTDINHGVLSPGVPSIYKTLISIHTKWVHTAPHSKLVDTALQLNAFNIAIEQQTKGFRHPKHH